MHWPAERFQESSPLERTFERLELVHGIGLVKLRTPPSWYKHSLVMPATALDSRVTTNDVIRELRAEEREEHARLD